MQKQSVSPVKGLVILLAVVVVIAGYVAAAVALHLTEMWAGFLFLLYWSMVEEAKPERLPKAVVGAFVGTAAAAALVLLPPAIGMGPGMAVALGFILLLIYAIIMGWVPVAVNMATMLFLTAGTIPHVQGSANFTQIFLGIAAGIAYFGGLALLAAAFARRKAAPVEA